MGVNSGDVADSSKTAERAIELLARLQTLISQSDADARMSLREVQQKMFPQIKQAQEVLRLLEQGLSTVRIESNSSASLLTVGC